MKLSNQYLLATALLGTGIVSADPLGPCQSNGICFSVGIPVSSAQSNSGNIYFQIKAPSGFSWVALGTGDQMSGSNIFLVYTDGQGNVTISPRRGTGHSEPQWDQSSTAAKLTLLAGSGVGSDGSLTANVACSNCQSWSGGDMSLQGTSVPWIAAWRTGSALATTNKGARISQHGGTTQFNLDLTQATINSDTNPFLASRDSSGDSGSNSGPGTGSGSGIGGGIIVNEGVSSSATILAAHGIIGALVMAVLYPLGSLLMPLLGRWWVHAAWQMVSFCLMWVAFGLGVQSAKSRGILFEQAHTILGTVVICLFAVQPLLGYLHHRQYVKTQGRSEVSYVHLWLGRILMMLGVVNGGLGLKLSEERSSLVIAYSVVAGIIFLCYFLAKGFTVLGNRNRSSGVGQTYKETDGLCGLLSRDFFENLSAKDLHLHLLLLQPTATPLPSPTPQACSIAHHTLRQNSARKAVAAVSRIAGRNAVPVRTFMAPTVSRRADFVQELYLKELKAYKPTPVKESDAVGQVATFSLPKTPKSPEEADLASSLKEYETMAVEVEGQEGADAGKPAAAIEDWLVEEEEDDDGHH
ncbi:hypothetical protein QBC38DRAFT_506922 [Podospora fimiseda]|uniref:DOMON domain-containing protein n=1 Tax=Podospora fimiseda TaxID=252190 RepID=A0AAN7BWZ6_9PEZI|nr:hypothetical protein QBC38DRAFT_506922 [Podospora fimiseda]